MYMKTFFPIPFAVSTDSQWSQAIRSSAEGRTFMDRIKAIFRAFPRCTGSDSPSSANLLNSSLVKLSSVTTPNGPWVYTIVPWED
jgi:hypothetical protein